MPEMARKRRGIEPLHGILREKYLESQGVSGITIGQSLNTHVGRDSSYNQHYLTTKQEDFHATQNLSKVLSSKFKKLNNINSSKSAMIYSRLQNEMFVSLNDLAKEENCNEILITRAFVKEEKQKKV